jgi:hypothetical protein
MAADGFTRTKGYPEESSKYDYFCNTDEFEGGKTSIINMNERELLDNLVAQIPCTYAEDEQSINGAGAPEDF